ncbi:MAG: hypothetical protein K1Y36_01115 [Blastocatellia bacterium]|nr:hypothetical protein [Blastocatellia bacterium]
MKKAIWLAFVCWCVGVGLNGQAKAQTAAFRYVPERNEPGVVYHYTKSNRDGSKPWNFDMYVASSSHVDVVKYDPKGPGHVNVAADMDWARMMPDHLTQYNIEAGKLGMTRSMQLARDAKSLQVAVGQGTLALPLESLPTHIYGFDLVSLNLTLRHLANPAGDFEIGLIQPNKPGENGLPVAIGRVKFTYVGEETCQKFACRKYKFTGAVLENKEGWIWVEKQRGFLVKAEHPICTSTDWTDWKLELGSLEPMNGFDWNTFKDKLVAERSGPTAVPLNSRLKTAFEKGGIGLALKEYGQAKKDTGKVTEQNLNTFGYTLLEAKKLDDAIEVFKLIVAEFPESANAYDSLAEAYAAAGKKELAITNYEKSLEIDSSNSNAEAQIKKLKGK